MAYQWQQSRVNLGYSVVPLSEEESANLPYLVYQVSPSQLPIIIDDQSQGRDDPLRLLKYSEFNYGAMLPLAE